MSEHAINERFIKVGKLPVSTEMKLGSSIQVQIPGEESYYHLDCVKIEHKDNQDGTEDVVYILKHAPNP